MDARFQAVNARFSTVDRRHETLRGRVDTMESEWLVFGERVEHRLDTMGQRFDAMDHRMDIVFDKVALEIKGTRRSMLLGMAGSTATTGFICLGTLAMAT